MAFYDPTTPGPVAARGWLITVQQLADLITQEMHDEPGSRPDLERRVLAIAGRSGEGTHRLGTGRYETLVTTRSLDGTPVVTFTGSGAHPDHERTRPAARYLATISGRARPRFTPASSLTKVRHCEYDGSPAPLQPDLHPADRRARGVVPRHRAAARGQPAAVRDRAADRRAVTARDLRERLDLDSGHLSRMLRRLEAEGLVSTTPDPADQRRRVVLLTDAGRTARQELDDRSEELAARIVAPLTDRQRERLTEALATADLLVRAATVRLREVPPDDPGARHALGRYLAEIDERFPTGYRVEGPVATAAGPGSTYVLATSDGEPVAYGGIRPAPAVDEHAIEIKRMWVHPDWRGAGLGSRMLRHLEALAAERGCSRLVLDTNGVLAEAIAMYERVGLPPDRALSRQRPARHPLLREGRHPLISVSASQSVTIGASSPSAQSGSWSWWWASPGSAMGARGHDPATGGAIGEVPDVAGDRAATALVGDAPGRTRSTARSRRRRRPAAAAGRRSRGR